jgi:hypothetical protein
MEQNDKTSQHFSHVIKDPITCSTISEMHPSVEDKNEDNIESSGTTLPLCFASFKWLKKNICNVLGQESSRHEGKYKKRSGDDNHMNNHIKGYVNSDWHPMFNCQPKKEEGAAPNIVVQDHFLSPETRIDIQHCFQHGKVFQSCLSSLENDVVVQFLSSLDMDEYPETASMETSNN